MARHDWTTIAREFAAAAELVPDLADGLGHLAVRLPMIEKLDLRADRRLLGVDLDNLRRGLNRVSGLRAQGHNHPSLDAACVDLRRLAHDMAARAGALLDQAAEAAAIDASIAAQNSNPEAAPLGPAPPLSLSSGWSGWWRWGGNRPGVGRHRDPQVTPEVGAENEPGPMRLIPSPGFEISRLLYTYKYKPTPHKSLLLAPIFLVALGFLISMVLVLVALVSSVLALGFVFYWAAKSRKGARSGKYRHRRLPRKKLHTKRRW